MINKRLIPVIIIKDGLVVQSYNFNNYLPIGRPEFIVKYLSTWECDEIIILDIDARASKRLLNIKLINELSKNVNIPLTIGGGISSCEDAETYFKNGADKISINSLFLDNNFSSICRIVEEYGSQSIVLSLDFIQGANNTYFLYDHRTKKNTGRDIQYIFQIIKNEINIGEILINSVNRDGSKLGYDLELLNISTELINKPILALGGANNVEHFLEIIDLNRVTGFCAANIFLHSEHSVEIFRSKINKFKKVLRPNNYFNYE